MNARQKAKKKANNDQRLEAKIEKFLNTPLKEAYPEITPDWSLYKAIEAADKINNSTAQIETKLAEQKPSKAPQAKKAQKPNNTKIPAEVRIQARKIFLEMQKKNMLGTHVTIYKNFAITTEFSAGNCPGTVSGVISMAEIKKPTPKFR